MLATAAQEKMTRVQSKPYPIYKDGKGQLWMANPDLSKFCGYSSTSAIKQFLLAHNETVLEKSNQMVITDSYPSGAKFYPSNSIIKICGLLKARRPWVQDLAKYLKSFGAPTLAKTPLSYDIKSPTPAFYWHGQSVWTAKQVPEASGKLDQLDFGKDYDYVPKSDLIKLRLLGRITGNGTKNLLVFFSPKFTFAPEKPAAPNCKKIAEGLGMVIAHSKTSATETIKYIIEEKGIQDPVGWIKKHGYPRYIGDFHVDYTHLKLDWDQIGKDPEYGAVSDKVLKLSQEIRSLLGTRNQHLYMELDEAYGQLMALEAEAAFRQGKEIA